MRNLNSEFRFGGKPLSDTINARCRLRRRRCRPHRRDGAAVAELPSLMPENADDALGRYRKVMTGLYAAGGLLHFPDLLGSGPISAAVGTSSFTELSPILQAVTVGWAVLGPTAAVGLSMGQAWGEAILVGVASTEIVLGVDFAEQMQPAAIPRKDKTRLFTLSQTLSFHAAKRSTHYSPPWDAAFTKSRTCCHLDDLVSLRLAPVVAAQVACLLSIIAIRGWKTVEDGNK